MKTPRIWAVIAARSGSKGLRDKNIRNLAGTPLLTHAIRFSKEADVFERILLSTDSEEYAKIGREHGAWVPFLRSSDAAQDASMEEHVLADLDEQLAAQEIAPPDIIVWLRPTFPFRSINDLKSALGLMDETADSVRIVTDGEPRLYETRNGYLAARFETNGRSMIRRQEFPAVYKVYHTDIFWYRNIGLGDKFLGERVRALPVHKICAMDVDGIEDFEMIEALMQSDSKLIRSYSHLG